MNSEPLKTLLIVCLSICGACFAQSTYYVTSTPDTPCPGSEEPCHTLSKYIANGFFKKLPKNTTIQFLSGNHTLETTIPFENLTSLVVLGDSSSLPEVTSRIVCTWPAGFAFTNITELHINALAFISCGHNGIGAINMTSVVQSYISRCTFESNYADNNYSVGGAIAAWYSSLRLKENTFQSSSAFYSGGAIFIQYGTLDLNTNTFLGNSAEDIGGAVTAIGGTSYLASNIFQGNSADYGGAIEALNGTLHLTSNTFHNNSANLGSGGVIDAQDMIGILTTNTFLGNSAQYGGAISSIGGTLNITKNTFLFNLANQGGAIHTQDVIISLTSNAFLGNSAQYGGAIATVHGTVNITSNTFHNNSAYQGGAIEANHTLDVSISTNTFLDNSAEFAGGAVIASGGTCYLASNTFQGNSAEYGGAIIALNVTLYLISNTFHNNSAYQAGAIDAQDVIGSLSTNTFLENSADIGGAITVVGVTLNITSNTFLVNSARYSGAIGAEYGTLYITSNTFHSNSAHQGGVMNGKDMIISLTNNTFLDNSAENAGGAIVVYGGTLYLTTTGNTFLNNSAYYYGGAIATQDGTVNFTNNTFHNNSAYQGGAIEANNTILSLSTNTFLSNSAKYGGGAIKSNGGTLYLTSNTFYYNSAYQAGAIQANDTIISLTTNTFLSNSARFYGGAVYIIAEHAHGALNITSNAFHNNSANQAGAIQLKLRAHDMIVSFTTNAFLGNSAENAGGAITVFAGVLYLTSNTFLDNSAEYGGAIIAVNGTFHLIVNTFHNNSAYIGGALHAISSALMLTDNAFHKNSALSSGGAFAAYGSTVHLTTTQNENNACSAAEDVSELYHHLTRVEAVSIDSNSATYGGGLYVVNTTVHGNAILTENSATEGGALFAYRGNLFFNDTTTIANNSAAIGGGLLLSDDSKIYLPSDTTIHFINNTANETGGAIHVKAVNQLELCVEKLQIDYAFYPYEIDCFFQIELSNKQPYAPKNINELRQFVQSLNISLHFENNNAQYAGVDLYGGLVDSCLLSSIKENHDYYMFSYSGVVFDEITSESKANITSDPVSFCVCKDDCKVHHHSQSVYPGGTVEVPVIALGQRNQPTIATIHVIDISNSITLKSSEYSQNISTGCSTLRYTVYSHAVETTQGMTLYANGPCSFDHPIAVTIDIQQCPPGFQLQKLVSHCSCDQRLVQYTDSCVVGNQTVLRPHNAEFWVGYSDDKGLILHPHCPFDYCTSEEMYLKVTNSDKQCNNNRSGLLCGRCSDNLTLVLGSSRCLQCSNSYLSLLAAFALAGIALILFLLLLRLTVAAGTINGLIFYANIVIMNSATFFRPETSNVLTVFIAWINLDLGIETCFYNGMDAYTKTWLQFVFPVYVWGLVGVMIIGSNYSGRMASMFGGNPVAVLATLFLLSYTKLLRTAIAALSYTALEYPNSQISVWLYDGNIGYLSSKHIPLFVIALICLLFLFLPYTVLLTAAQWLQAKSEWRIFSWINNRYLFSFLDAYHAPYSTRRRYSIGAMLVLRLVLFLITAVNVLGDPRINLLAVLAALILTIPAILAGTGIYKSWYLSVLEVSFLVNLAILVSTTLYIYPNEANQNAVTFTSVSIAFATFIGVVIYHFIKQVRATQLWKKLFPRHEYVRVPLDDEDGAEEDPPDRVYVSGCAPTQTVVDIRELRRERMRRAAERQETHEATELRNPCEEKEPHEPLNPRESQEATY